MADLAALRELYAWMREEQILYARCGELELRLSPPAPASAPLVEQPLDEREERRRSIEALLWSSGADPSPFMVDG
ncbi:MAG: hypothetical protein NVS2B6_17140 [Thermoleophilaceae bacterium]